MYAFFTSSPLPNYSRSNYASTCFLSYDTPEMGGGGGGGREGESFIYDVTR